MTEIIQETISKTNFGINTFPELYGQDNISIPYYAKLLEKDCNV